MFQGLGMGMEDSTQGLGMGMWDSIQGLGVGEGGK